MKPGRVQACIDYIKFNQEAEGFELSFVEEESLRRLLEGDALAADQIREIQEEEGLVVSHVLQIGRASCRERV